MHEVYLQDLLSERGGGDAGHSLAITHFPYVIGRHPDCDGRFGAPWVSRRHCRFFLAGDEVWLEDLNSCNGTILNSEPLNCARVVQEGDRLEFAGMAFQVRLLAAPAAPALTREDQPHSTPAGQQRQQILVVEDNTDTAETLALLLRQWGHDVAVAHDGPEAISLARERQPRTVLLDIRLPGMDGYEVAKRLRTHAGLQEARLVAMTGCRDPEDAHRSQDAGLQALLIKPVAPDVLRQVIEDSHASCSA